VVRRLPVPVAVRIHPLPPVCLVFEVYSLRHSTRGDEAGGKRPNPRTE
jgi:hypothetical protein